MQTRHHWKWLYFSRQQINCKYSVTVSVHIIIGNRYEGMQLCKGQDATGYIQKQSFRGCKNFHINMRYDRRLQLSKYTWTALLKFRSKLLLKWHMRGFAGDSGWFPRQTKTMKIAVQCIYPFPICYVDFRIHYSLVTWRVKPTSLQVLHGIVLNYHKTRFCIVRVICYVKISTSFPSFKLGSGQILILK